VANFSTCEGVAEIQIIWCDAENDPPKDLYTNFTNVKLVRRASNSLNERYNLSSIGAPTLGIIHIDDDDLFPCFTLDHRKCVGCLCYGVGNSVGTTLVHVSHLPSHLSQNIIVFFKWTYNPERLVALQPRKHDEEHRMYYGWARHPKSAVEHAPRGCYTLALPTPGGVVHRDYLDWYMKYFPRQFFHEIARQFNCEDITLSYFITALTKGKAPLLGDFWAMRSSKHVTDYQKSSAISANGNTHKKVRCNCTTLYELGLDLVPYNGLLSNMGQEDPERF
jgi:glucuronyl/N-acetylglucosaminyl transferase EXT2